MSARGVRIVVGEGPSTRKGLLRFVLDGEGYDVVAEASTTAELARLMATHRPDVVVVDDGIGATAVGMINEMSPNTKVVLVWPGAVMPIGGAARVEPARVLQDLGATIERLTGQPSATGAGRGAALLDRATNDPDMLRALLLGGMRAIDEPIIEDREPAPVVILPLTPTIDHDELVLNVPDAEQDDQERAGAAARAAGVVAGATVLAGSVPAAAAAAEAGAAAAGGSLAARGGVVGAQSALNRRLGNLALGGAAVASALVLALALGGARIPIAEIRGQAGPTVTSPSPETTQPPQPNDTPDPNGNPFNNQSGDENFGGTTFPDVTLTGNVSPEVPGPPDVVIDPGDIAPGDGTGGGGTGGSDGGGGTDDHSGRDSGDHDRGGGNDRDGGDHDNGGGNDGDGGDHDNGGGNDDEDNPAHGDGDGGEPAEGDGGDAADAGDESHGDGGDLAEAGSDDSADAA